MVLVFTFKSGIRSEFTSECHPGYHKTGMNKNTLFCCDRK